MHRRGGRAFVRPCALPYVCAVCLILHPPLAQLPLPPLPPTDTYTVFGQVYTVRRHSKIASITLYISLG